MVTLKYSLHVTRASDSRIRGGVLGPLQAGTDKCVGPGAKDSGYICTSYETLELGNLGAAKTDSTYMCSLGAAKTDSTYMCSLQSVHWRTDLEGYRRQIAKDTLSEQG